MFKQVSVAGPEGHNVSSAVVDYKTLPDQPGRPGKPSLHGAVQPHTLHVVWGKTLLYQYRVIYNLFSGLLVLFYLVLV